MVFGSAVVENQRKNGIKTPVNTKRTCILQNLA